MIYDEVFEREMENEECEVYAASSHHKKKVNRKAQIFWLRQLTK